MNAAEFTDLQTLVDQTIAGDLANPLPGRHVTRWARIIEINNYLKSVAEEHSLTRPPKRRSEPNVVSYYETPEWKALVSEALLLEHVERQQAIEADWPVWQARQHFQYLANGVLREGEVLSFDLESQTVHCSTWPFDDFHGYLDREGFRHFEIISVQQINAAIQQEAEAQAAEQSAAIERALIEEQSRLPLFADQLS